MLANPSLWSIKEPIDTPEKMFLWSKSNIRGVWLLCVFQSDVKNRVSELKLEERSESLSTVPSTRATTCIFAQVYLLLRCEESLLMCKHNPWSQVNKINLSISDCLRGRYIACKYDDGLMEM